MRNIQEWDGIDWHEDTKGYYRATVDKKNKYLHREVYRYYCGKIPKGYHVHHIDEDKSNNHPSNLQCLSKADHCSLHKKGIRPSDKALESYKQAGLHRRGKCTDAQRKHLASINHLSKSWHSSPEGIKKHREIGALAYKNFEPVEKLCVQCFEYFMPKKLGNQDRFCSNKCKSQWRRDEGLDNIERVCPICEKEYETNKYRKTKTCSRACAAHYKRRKKKGL